MFQDELTHVLTRHPEYFTHICQSYQVGSSFDQSRMGYH